MLLVGRFARPEFEFREMSLSCNLGAQSHFLGWFAKYTLKIAPSTHFIGMGHWGQTSFCTLRSASMTESKQHNIEDLRASRCYANALLGLTFPAGLVKCVPTLTRRFQGAIRFLLECVLARWW